MNKYQQEDKEGENRQQDAFAWQVVEALGYRKHRDISSRR
jgi:hypothetical protein